MCIRDRDKLSDQMSMEEFIDPFTGEPVEGYKKKKKSKRPFEGQWVNDVAAVKAFSGRMTSATACPYRAGAYHVF